MNVNIFNFYFVFVGNRLVFELFNSNRYFFDYLLRIIYFGFFVFEIVLFLEIEFEIIMVLFNKVYGLYFCFICFFKCLCYIILKFIVNIVN